MAVEAAHANVKSNGVQNVVSAELGSLDKAMEKFELVLVNILARVIIKLASQGLVDRVQPAGLMIASGIIEEQEAEVTAALREHGLEITERLQEKDWVTLIGRREVSATLGETTKGENSGHAPLFCVTRPI